MKEPKPIDRLLLVLAVFNFGCVVGIQRSERIEWTEP